MENLERYEMFYRYVYNGDLLNYSIIYFKFDFYDEIVGYDLVG